MFDLPLFYKQNPWQKGGFGGEDFISRVIKASILKWVPEKEILIIKGARQVGKSTLLRQIIEHLMVEQKVLPTQIFYFTFDDRKLREMAKNEPQQLFDFIDSVASKEERVYVFFDEAQKAPEIFESIKIIYDRESRYKFFLSGSSLLGLTGKAAEALSGRTIDFSLYPLTIGEIFASLFPQIKQNLALENNTFPELLSSFEKWKEREQKLLLFRKEIEIIIDNYFMTGGYPRVYRLNEIEKKQELLRNIKNDYLERDIQGLIKKEKFSSFVQLVDLLAFQTGNLINHQELGSAASLSYKTLRNFISLLENTHILFLLPPFGRGRRNLIKKNPKVYFNDLGLRNVSLGFASLPPSCGQLAENLVFNSLNWLKSYKNFRHNLYFARTTAGSEVDFILESGEQCFPLEVKYSSMKRPIIPRALLGFMESLKIQKGLVITKDLLAQRKIKKFEILFIPLWLWVSTT